jgi:hypothetical protein
LASGLVIAQTEGVEKRVAFVSYWIVKYYKLVFSTEALLLVVMSIGLSTYLRSVRIVLGRNVSPVKELVRFRERRISK